MCVENLKEEIKKLSNEELNELVKIIDKNAKKSVAEVVFTGTLSNGKSMVVNALIGQNLLPSSVGSTTANLFMIKKGDEDKIVSYLNDKIEEYKLTPEKLKELNNNKYDKIEIYLKDFPYNNVAFVDTPGINDIDEEKELISLEYVPLSDAVVFVLDIAKGLTKKEKEFFENKILKSHKDKIFILLNKLDTIDDEGNIPDILKDYQVFKVSAKKYLTGIIKNKKENITQSNFLEFKNNFEKYLNSLDVLKIKRRRIEKFLNDIEKIALFQIDEMIKNFSYTQEELNEKLNNLQKELKEKEVIVQNTISDIDNKVNEFKKFVNERISTLKENIKNLNDKDEIINEFEKFNLDLKNKALDIFNKDLNEYNIDFDFMDNVLFVINDILKHIDEIIAILGAIGGLLKDKLKDKIPIDKIIKFLTSLKIGESITNSIKKLKIDSSINKNIENLQAYIQSEIENMRNELIRELEFKELAEIKASIYAIKSSKQKIEHQKEDMQTRINYLEKEKENLRKLIKTCKEELC